MAVTAPPDSTSRYQERRSRGKQPMSMELDDNTAAWLRQQSEVEDRSMASIVRTALKEYRSRHSAEG